MIASNVLAYLGQKGGESIFLCYFVKIAFAILRL